MKIEQQLSKGQLYIADEVIAMITNMAISEVEGFYGTVSRFKDRLIRLVSKNASKKGIMIQKEPYGLIIKVQVSVVYGMEIHELCYRLQKTIKEQVERLTGIPVKEINVCIDEIHMA